MTQYLYQKVKNQWSRLPIIILRYQCAPAFLRQRNPQFFDSKGNSKLRVGLLQFGWSYNLLSKYDGLNLDTSHVIEQTAHCAYLKAFNFNLTAGIWRKQAIQAETMFDKHFIGPKAIGKWRDRHWFVCCEIPKRCGWLLMFQKNPVALLDVGGTNVNMVFRSLHQQNMAWSTISRSTITQQQATKKLWKMQSTIL